MLLLSEYTITYEPAKAVKEQAVADFLAGHPITGSETICNDFPNEQVMMIESQDQWQMYFDGASRASGAGAGVIFITPQGDLLAYSFTLGTGCMNNEAEYQAHIIGMEIAHENKIKTLHIFGDYKLIINQLTTEFEIRKQELLPYCRKAQQLLEQFYHVKIKHVPQSKNARADALASMAAALSYSN
ncbi:uncharacterized protein LOC131254250 [Magnolia sinica]|uniref:uncharacterized protein LOC131254250 n=1 Tax=Magnolia sinica TaxID=86752 RepID=UPI0026587534|nr:uncharacterized protein LOC131254250 [Magnolia sinica]